jgi:LAO/AO transport system kinase
LAQPKNSNAEHISKTKGNRKILPSPEQLTQGIFKGDATSLARAITLVESTQKENLQAANTIIKKCLSAKTKSIRVGVTGVPGVGKSTFIEVLGKLLTSQGKKVAVLAIDPTSTETKGSILGDKTRMPELVKDPKAFIRPSPSGTNLGGVTRKTRETVILCEAAGYEVILIETVGVGQSETLVHSMVDFFLVLKLPGAGDELQGIKRGIIEMADAIVINKADGDNLKAARIAQMDFNKALHLYPPKADGWVPKVLSCSALKNEGIGAVWDLITDYNIQSRENGSFEARRKQQNKHWLLQTLEDRLKHDFYENPIIKADLKKMLVSVMENEVSPFAAAEALLATYKRKSN